MARVDSSVSCLASPLGSSYPSRFFLIVIGAGSDERGEAVGSGRGSLFLPVARAFYSRITIGPAGRGAGMGMTRRSIQLDFSYSRYRN